MKHITEKDPNYGKRKTEMESKDLYHKNLEVALHVSWLKLHVTRVWAIFCLMLVTGAF